MDRAAGLVKHTRHCLQSLGAGALVNICSVCQVEHAVSPSPLILLPRGVLQGLANMLWAFAKLGKPVPRFCSAAAVEVVRRMSAFSLRDLSQILWAFAKLEHRGSAAAVSAMAEHTAAILRADGEAANFVLKSTCGLIWALRTAPARCDWLPDCLTPISLRPKARCQMI